ncbi:hypothetical protein [Chryseobacterium sp. MP_3.2]|uniref:hypothetical protein n=1 Tax=Chryseobacterium sp. MP_3.2 TaxID=3071712 RepID=UPI002E03B545|nr:hypothetical protein [Chryseobacterium sp. MP_3.2]
MKSNFIKILANPDNKKDSKVYNELLNEYAPIAGARQVYHYQLGYTPNKLVNLKYEIQKNQGISDKEIALYDPSLEEEEEVVQDPPKKLTKKEIEAAKKAEEAEALAQKNAETLENPILKGLDESSWDGLKLRDEYPFLNEENTPDVYKVLVSDKITAYKNYAAKHAEALEAADQGEAEDKLFALASGAIKDYQNNIDIKDELDFYRESKGKVLGKHPKLKNLKIEQEIGEMSEADLVKHRGNALKSVSKYAKAENKEKEAEWTFRLVNAERNLIDKFNYKFEK